MSPNIPSNYLLVMDNAPYHSRRKKECPVQSWTKKKMAEWLNAKYSHPEKCLKTDLWSIVITSQINLSTMSTMLLSKLAIKLYVSW